MKLTKILTRDHPEDVKNMFRRMCFNVFAHNRDDHSKNFTYLYHEAEECWRLSPAYDLTYSSTYYGEHTTMVTMGMDAIRGKRDFGSWYCCRNGKSGVYEDYESDQRTALNICWENILCRQKFGACDYGFNIYTQGLAVINYNCVTQYVHKSV